MIQRGYDNVFVLSGGLRVAKIKVRSCFYLIGPNWHEGSYFYLLVFFLDQILSTDFSFKKFLTFLEVKIDINWVNLTPWQAH